MAISTVPTRTDWRTTELERSLSSVRERVRTRDTPLKLTPTLELLSAIFELSRFESEVLLLCAAAELDTDAGKALAQLQGSKCVHPTFGLALSLLDQAAWEAVAPHAPLRRWDLLTMETGSTLLTSPLRIDERVLHFVVGIDSFDPRLRMYMQPLLAAPDLVASQQAIAMRMAALWQTSAEAVQLAGLDGGAKRAIVTHACAAMGWRAFVWSVDALPEAAELDRVMRLWQREAALSRALLVMDAERVDGAREQMQVERFVRQLASPCVVLVRQRWPSQSGQLLTLDVVRPLRQEQQAIWRKATLPEVTDDEVSRVSAHFDFDADAIRVAAAAWRSDPGVSLWRTARQCARAAVEGLAQTITPRAGWEDLVLDAGMKQRLRRIASQVRHRSQVYDTWRIGERGPNGLGITALFAGPSGTGKTLAAEVIAHELELDVCRVDLSQLVSKYIGETEKNIARICEAAEQSGAVLLFDEADALFGKRSEVKDSHDRHANIEVSYLLQRMEVYRGLALLTTNLAENIDPAFLRRLRFVLHFRLPEAAERAAIWQRMFPREVPLQNVDFNLLARLQVAGGNIRNIAMTAMFLAAEHGTGVTMPLLLEGARMEYSKLERTLRDSEIEGWV
ncbi:AAA+ family ATPase [Terriglobus roseus DSM 18391]|uniref:AAA+ family ATPase n=1 Tax=Terriglobus roseus (strain DSM 18391 / NRRL B-41598 / KBS 63) TaxID=926566 RepID=I3ZHN7_TERRK|nr:ATP-binding protein [Terriglobus roseus]AFL88415.1 AAA+ family ATPase [Terriglobus roseus DSM 18391]AFL88755.1 AAA+ family ATPase [Terriglobus roseus DSM 18391]